MMKHLVVTIFKSIQRMHVLVVLSVVSALASSATASGDLKVQALITRPQDVFSDIQRSVEILKRETIELPFEPRAKERIKHALTSIDEDIDFIQAVVLKSRKRQIPEAYLRSLKLDAELLQYVSARASKGSADPIIASTLELVASDLDLKGAYIRSSRSASLRLVEVLVHTVKMGKETGGYEVWYVPLGWADEPSEYRRFGRLSSPTYHDLAPGSYFVWARLDGKESEKTTISIGKNGRSRDEVDLNVK